MKEESKHTCRYSKEFNQPHPRLCTICGKEEPKQETEHLLSTETNKKRLLEDVNKQETLEEVAETELYITINKIIDGGKNLIKGTNVSRGQAVDYAFDIALKIAKWQAERMYSEEEVLDILRNFYTDFDPYKNPPQTNTIPLWFEQFKNK